MRPMEQGWIRFVCEVAADRLRAALLGLSGVTLGRKVRVGPRCMFSRRAGVRLGERAWLEADVSMKLSGPSASVEVGDHVFFGRFCHVNVLDRLEIGAHTLFGPGCVVVDHNHGMAPGQRIDEQPCVARPIRIGRDVWCGAGVVVLPGISIGDGAVIGANSTVTRDVPAMAVVAGNPARLLRMRNGADHGS